MSVVTWKGVRINPNDAAILELANDPTAKHWLGLGERSYILEQAKLLERDIDKVRMYKARGSVT